MIRTELADMYDVSEDFDYFNDYKNTKTYLQGIISRLQNMVDLLDEGRKEDTEDHVDKFLKTLEGE